MIKRKEKINIKNGKAITLVALVVTIIILLVLAGITIGNLINTGLIDKSKISKTKFENTVEKENTTLLDYENEITATINGTREQITIDKEEYNNLKMAIEYKVYDNLNEIIDINSNVKEIEGQVKRQGKVINVNLLIAFKRNVTSGNWIEVGKLKDSSFIPEVDTWGYLAQATNGGNFCITKDGVIKLRGASSSTGYIGNIIYFSK